MRQVARPSRRNEATAPAAAGAAGASSHRDHVVFLIHGIRTRAEWQERVRSILESDPSIWAIPLRYGFLDVVRFLLPTQATRRAPVERAARLVRDEISRSGPAKLSVIAHSFGTFVVGELLARHPDLSFHRTILCGSIVREDFPWENYPHRLGDSGAGAFAVVNDCGTRDVWPVLAKAMTWGFGPSGRFGFGHPRVRDRFHAVDHSGFFEDSFVRSFWLPYLSKGTIAEGDLERSPTPWLLSFVPNVKIPIVAFVIAAIMAIGMIGRGVEGAGASSIGLGGLGGVITRLNCVNEMHTCAFQLVLENPGPRELALASIRFRVERFDELGQLGARPEPIEPLEELGFDLTGLTSAGELSEEGALAVELPSGARANVTLCFRAKGMVATFGRWKLRPIVRTTSGVIELEPMEVDLPWDPSKTTSDPQRWGEPFVDAAGAPIVCPPPRFAARSGARS